ncbi:PREDICTED: paired amphipathic helix protein Sin3a [Amphimedon queenslandica]|uniref:Paired amphipathic helix protein Sin3a n=1 Tax=Amphimedon queenslandica TaxID=400682 RepID=A0A1X7VJY1_AMPQE|nr:PREDICTED: paired amphipathic helix protein Sin3a [Amphimedon queenslandica]|eukprot:XP_019864517.1 PREDICTED: paired amphipathic helix protein Sin3a [Amphimedon queenslandica]
MASQIGVFSSDSDTVNNSSTMSAAVAMTTSHTSANQSSCASDNGSVGQGTVVSPSSSAQFQRLKVEDALSYLDQVKLQFGNQPQVYNDFLDIMKEFKSQSIDTPGVISRVSNLFKGHPDLIVGFNTFLPPGFKIEVHGQNEINIQGPAQHSHTLQQIAMRHNAAAAAAAASAGNQSGTGQTQRSSPSSSSNPALTGQQKGHQPVEFNHAINYVNKIKNRFQGQPDVYKAFLEILHTYQKEQRLLKDGGIPSTTPLSETEVYGQVSKLFQNQEDLLSEFGQFLPDATSSHSLLGFAGPLALAASATKKQSGKSGKAHSRKSSQSSSAGLPSKKSKNSAKDVLAEAGKHGNYVEVALFDKIRKALHNPEVYDNFLRCLMLFNEEIVSRQELTQLVTPFLGKFPDLFCQFKVLLGFKEPSTAELSPEPSPPPQIPHKERVTEFAAEIDFNSLKRHGASYRALPKSYVQLKCSGRTRLCHEVLNDTWVSFPMWSEDTTFHGTRKTQYEEYIFRCEDERFELDVVLETNLSTIKVLEAIQKKMSRMSPETLNHFTLDNRLGGFSEVIHRKAIHRIYGDKATDIIEGLKRNPAVAIPIVLKRLKSKQEDWLDAQRQFNKMWREQLEKYHLKSLDHQGINFKASDTKIMRPKSLIGEVECLFDERQESFAEGKAADVGPHLSFRFTDENHVFNDAVGLVMYYMKRASSLTKEEATKVKVFLTRTLSAFCYYPDIQLTSEDDLSFDSDSDAMDVSQDVKDPDANPRSLLHSFPETPSCYHKLDHHTIFTNNTVYAFFRLIQFLCERLSKVYSQSLMTIQEHNNNGTPSSQESIAVKLGLRKLPGIQVDEYYPTFLNMAKNFMEGNIDSSSYEDTCREMFGVHAYLTFTMDRLVQNIARQLHVMIAEENCLQIIDEYGKFVEELEDSVTTSSLAASEMIYQKKMEEILADENCFKIIMTRSKTLTIELLESDDSSDDTGIDSTKKCLSYVEQYSKDDSNFHEFRSLVQERKTFLMRTHRDPTQLTCTTTVEMDCSLGSSNPLLQEFDIHGAIEFKMDDRTYRMIPLANSEDYMYRKGTLSKAKQVNPWVFAKQKSQFNEWYDNWSHANVTTELQKSCDDWFSGLSVTEGDHSLTEQVIQDYNGQKCRFYRTS